MATKKYYWLKLKRDFFKRHDIRIVEEMPNGKDYVLFYLKMLLESIDHNGQLRFSETIPYNEQMLSIITNTNIDLVRSAMKVFLQLKMIEIMDDETIYMTEVKRMTGTETAWAEKKRLYRGKDTEDTVRTLSSSCPPVVRQEIERELEIEKEQETEVEKESVATAVASPSGKPARKKYGTYGWVRLSDEEHKRLLADLGQAELDRCIAYVDESAQSNGNKNKWKDWNLVIRRCSKNRWGLNQSQARPAKTDTLGILGRMMEEGK